MMDETRVFTAHYNSPIGTIKIVAAGRGIRSVGFVRARPAGPPARHSLLRAASRELDEYFQGKRKEFSLPLVLGGTEFQRKVWQALLQIPFGHKSSYKEVAIAIGKPRAVRAVGQANHDNRLGIVVPCHRVIGSSGKLVGYGGGLWRKKWLLGHERRWSESQGEK